MLRSVRSLPALRVLESTVQKEIKQQSKNFSTISTKYNLVVPNIPDHQVSTKYQTISRSVHQSSKQNATTLFNSKNSEFSVMSLNSLKGECRKRGLKISGKKAELVSRISTYEQSFQTKQVGSIATKASKSLKSANKMKPLPKLPTGATAKSFTTTTKKQAKGDDSTIDYIKPVDIAPPKLVSDDYIVQIPSISTEASAKPVTKLEKQLSEQSVIDPNLKVVSKADGSDTKIYEQSSINKIEEQNIDAHNADVTQIYSGIEPEEHYKYEEGEISGSDKTFFAAAAAVVGGWWFFKPKKNDH